MSLALQIFIALVLAIAADILLGNGNAQFANDYIKPFGTIFLNLIKFIVCPIVLFSIMCGIISMKDVRQVGSIGLKTVVFYLCTTAVAIVILLRQMFHIFLSSPETFGGLHPAFLLLLSGAFLLSCIVLRL